MKSDASILIAGAVGLLVPAITPTPYNAFIANLIRLCRSLSERRETP